MRRISSSKSLPGIHPHDVAQIFAGSETVLVTTALQILAQARTAAPQHGQSPSSIMLYSYPSLFGVADNNSCGWSL
jgi:hypothetical protein